MRMKIVFQHIISTYRKGEHMSLYQTKVATSKQASPYKNTHNYTPSTHFSLTKCILWKLDILSLNLYCLLILKQQPNYKNLQGDWKTAHRLHLQGKRTTYFDSLKSNYPGRSRYLGTFDNLTGKSPSLSINWNNFIDQKKPVSENIVWERREMKKDIRKNSFGIENSKFVDPCHCDPMCADLWLGKKTLVELRKYSLSSKKATVKLLILSCCLLWSLLLSQTQLLSTFLCKLRSRKINKETNKQKHKEIEQIFFLKEMLKMGQFNYSPEGSLSIF